MTHEELEIVVTGTVKALETCLQTMRTMNEQVKLLAMAQEKLIDLVAEIAEDVHGEHISIN